MYGGIKQAGFFDPETIYLRNAHLAKWNKPIVATSPRLVLRDRRWQNLGLRVPIWFDISGASTSRRRIKALNPGTRALALNSSGLNLARRWSSALLGLDGNHLERDLHSTDASGFAFRC